MYYLSGHKQGARYGVVDTEDGVEDYLSMPELLSAESNGYKIYGLLRNKGYIHCLGVTQEFAHLLRLHKQVPFPVAVRLSRGLGFRQTLYIGYRIRKGVLEFVFFDDSGDSGLCIVSNLEIITHPGDVSLDFRNINSRRADVLMRRLKDSGGFLL